LSITSSFLFVKVVTISEYVHLLVLVLNEQVLI
jgi:hypothetical protein